MSGSYDEPTSRATDTPRAADELVARGHSRTGRMGSPKRRWGRIIAGLTGASLIGLKAWSGWLELKRLELSQIAGDRGLPPASGRIEIADLRERVRKLEAIAAGIDI